MMTYLKHKLLGYWSIEQDRVGIFMSMKLQVWIWPLRWSTESALLRAPEVSLVTEAQTHPRPCPHTTQEADFFSSFFIVRRNV